MANENTSTVVRWGYQEPDDDSGFGSGDGLPGGDGDGSGSVNLELVDSEDPCGTWFASLLSGGNGAFSFEIKAYVSPSDLNYNMETTNGSLVKGPLTEAEFSETISFRGRDTGSTSEESNVIETFAWEGKIRNELGEITTAPSVTIDGNTVTLSKPVHADMRVTGTSVFVLWTLNLAPKSAGSYTNSDGETEEEAEYAATVTAYYQGGYSELRVSFPKCKYSFQVNPDDDDDLQCYERVIYVDPCTGEVDHEELIRVSCDS